MPPSSSDLMSAVERTSNIKCFVYTFFIWNFNLALWPELLYLEGSPTEMEKNDDICIKGMGVLTKTTALSPS